MKKPCKECPFRKQSAPGYLGAASWQPELFLSQIEHRPMSCHMSVDWEAGEEDSDHVCVGSLQFLKNSCKLPRDKDYAEIVRASERSEDIFQNRQQFINHHSKQ